MELKETIKEKYGEAARLRAAEHFTADLMAQRIEALYARLGVLPFYSSTGSSRDLGNLNATLTQGIGTANSELRLSANEHR